MFSHTIMTLDEQGLEGRKMTDRRLDFGSSKTVKINNELFVIKEGNPVVTFKYSNIGDFENLIKTRYANLPYNGYLEEFSICNLADRRVILSGGEDADENPSAKVFSLDPMSKKWQTRALPNLNVARSKHNSLSIGE